MYNIKRNLSCLLVISLMNYFGCYTTQSLSLNELDKIDINERVTLITKDNIEYNLNNDSVGYNNIQWRVVKDKFYITSCKLTRCKDLRGQEVVKNV